MKHSPVSVLAFWYGYIGDSTPDNNSLLGIGNSKFALTPGSLQNNYSAALTIEGARKRGLTPVIGPNGVPVASGQEFTHNGKTYRWDDTFKGQSDYVDIYDNAHAPDQGVSQEEIARQSAVASKRPGFSGTPEVAQAKPAKPEEKRSTNYHLDQYGEKHDAETGDTVDDEEAAQRTEEEAEAKEQEREVAAQEIAAPAPTVEPAAPAVRYFGGPMAAPIRNA